MPQTTTAFPTSATSAGGTALTPTAWTTPNNVFADDNANATSSGAALTGGTQVLTGQNFNLLAGEGAGLGGAGTGVQIPAGASILGVRLYYDAAASNGTLTLGGTAGGTALTTQAKTTAQSVVTTGFGTLSAGSTTAAGNTFGAQNLGTEAGQAAARALLANGQILLTAIGGAGSGLNTGSYAMDYYKVEVQWIIRADRTGGAQASSSKSGAGAKPIVRTTSGQGSGGTANLSQRLLPNGDISGIGTDNNQTWAPTPAGAGYTTIDDSAVQPATPNTSDLLTFTVAGPATAVFDVETFALPSNATVSTARLWFYWAPVNTNSHSFAAALTLANGTVLATTTLTNGVTSGRWDSVTYTGTLTQSQIDGLRMTITGSNTLNNLFIYAMYADVAYSYPLASATAGPRASGGGAPRAMTTTPGGSLALARSGGSPFPLVSRGSSGGQVVSSKTGGSPVPLITASGGSRSAAAVAGDTFFTKVVSKAPAGAIARALSGGSPKIAVQRLISGGRVISSRAGGQPKTLTRNSGGAAARAANAGSPTVVATTAPSGAIASSKAGGVARVYSFSISGVARSGSSNAPISGVRCKVYRFSDDAVMGSAISDGSGYFAVPIAAQGSSPLGQNINETFWIRYWKGGFPNMFATTDDNLTLVVSQVQGPPE